MSNTPIKKWVDLNEHFSKDEKHMANKPVKRCSTSLMNREMKMKTTRYHLKLIRIATIKKTKTNTCC